MKVAPSRATLCLGALALSLGACATGGTTSAADALRSRTVRSSPFTLTRTELLSVPSGKNLFDVVELLRPTFLRGRFGIPTLALDGMLVGSATYMTTMMPAEVESIQLLDGLDATTRFGARHNGAVLLVTTRAR